MDLNLHTNKSTNGRVAESKKSDLPETLQRAKAVLKALDFISPQLSARAAEPLFMTPRKHRRPPEEVRAVAEARRETWKIAGHQVPVYSWGTGPVVLFSHGWEGRGSQVAPFLGPLLANGVRVVAWDQPGHGDAEAARLTVIDFTEVLEGIVRRVGQVHAVIGHSLGGTAATYARSRGRFGKRLVTIASPLHPREFLAEFGRTLELSPAALAAMKARLGARYGVNFADFDLRQVTYKVDTEALVVHDRSDREVPYEHGLELFRHWPTAELFTTEGLGHRRILRDPNVIAKVVEVVAKAPREPSCEQLISAELYEPELRAG